MPAQTVEVGTDRDEKLVVNLLELPTFFVYDRLNISDLINFSGTDFTRYRFLLQSWLCASSNGQYLYAPPNMEQIPLLPYMVAVESADCDNLIRLCDYRSWFGSYDTNTLLWSGLKGGWKLVISDVGS